MDIVEALTEHHAVLRRLAQEAEQRPEAFAEYERQLTAHHTMEEKYFYDFLLEFGAARHDALEGVNEHHIIEMIILDARRFPREHELFGVKVEGLAEYTAHHLDEEEADIFPLARRHMPQKLLAELGGQFRQAMDIVLGISLPPAGGKGPAAKGLVVPEAGKPERAPRPPEASGAAEVPRAPEIPATAQPRPGAGLGLGSLKARA